MSPDPEDSEGSEDRYSIGQFLLTHEEKLKEKRLKVEN